MYLGVHDAGVGLGGLLEDRREGSAWATPRSSEVDQDDRIVQDRRFEIAKGEFLYGLRVHPLGGGLGLPAQSLVPDAGVACVSANSQNAS